MSTILWTPGRYHSLGRTLIDALHRRRNDCCGTADPVPWGVERIIRYEHPENSWDTLLAADIRDFCNRLYIANQKAYNVRYDERNEVVDLDPAGFEAARPWDQFTLLWKLRAILYNCDDELIPEDEKRVLDLITDCTMCELEKLRPHDGSGWAEP